MPSPHSYLRARIGSIREALLAGKYPASPGRVGVQSPGLLVRCSLRLREQLLMAVKNAIGFGSRRFKRPLTLLVAAAKDDPITTWKHIEVAGGGDEGIVNFGLWQQDSKLSFNRHEFFVVE